MWRWFAPATPFVHRPAAVVTAAAEAYFRDRGLHRERVPNEADTCRLFVVPKLQLQPYGKSASVLPGDRGQPRRTSGAPGEAPHPAHDGDRAGRTLVAFQICWKLSEARPCGASDRSCDKAPRTRLLRYVTHVRTILYVR